MENERNDAPMVFNPKPIGEMVNPHVRRQKPEPEPDYAAMQRRIKKSAEMISGKGNQTIE